MLLILSEIAKSQPHAELTVAQKYNRVFRFVLSVRRHLCLAFLVRRHSCLTFLIRRFSLPISHPRFPFPVRRFSFPIVSRSSFLASRFSFSVFH
jgi:hypothetical protein